MNTEHDIADVSWNLWRDIVDRYVPPDHYINRVRTKGEAESIRKNWHRWKRRETSQYHVNRTAGIWLTYEKEKERIRIYRGRTQEEVQQERDKMARASWNLGYR